MQRSPTHPMRMPVSLLRLVPLPVVLLLAACSMVQPVLQSDELISAGECWRQTKSLYGDSDSSVSSALGRNVESFKLLVEQSLVHREVAIDTIQQLLDEGKIEGKEPLSGRDLDRLNAGLMEHLSLRANLYDVANAQSCWLKPSEKIYQRLAMQPISEENRLKGTMLSLSAALFLYDNYLMMTSLYLENGKLRRFLNERDSAYEKGRNELERLAVSYNSSKKRAIVKRAIRYYEQQRKIFSAQMERDRDFAYLDVLIRQSQAYNMLHQSGGLGFVGRRLAFMATVTNDDLLKLKDDGVNLFSSLFGNTMGLVETRRGKLYNKPAVQNQLSNQLRAGDILLEKTPFRLTDKLIPGHWGHAAIWIGTEEELKTLGLWNDPAVTPYHERIRAGRSVVEALRSGVKMNSLHHFLNVDDLAVLRSPGSDREAQAKRILLALKQVGKAYDFNFDVETTDKIVCSELVYTVYTDMRWPTEKALGRYTISPDNVAMKAVAGHELELVSFYHDGEKVEEQPLELMRQLIGLDRVAKEVNREERGRFG